MSLHILSFLFVSSSRQSLGRISVSLRRNGKRNRSGSLLEIVYILNVVVLTALAVGICENDANVRRRVPYRRDVEAFHRVRKLFLLWTYNRWTQLADRLRTVAWHGTQRRQRCAKSSKSSVLLKKQ